jgi:hypothetical protein
MEYTKNNLSPEIKTFFKKLSNYIGEKVYFYGSVQRFDYFPEHSDIDIHVFSDNIHELINRLRHYLHLKNKYIKKIMIYLSESKYMVYGYKIIYRSNDLKLKTEITVYSNKYKKVVLKDDNAVINIPSYIVFVLFILKVLYYQLSILDKQQFNFYKCNLINNYVYFKNSENMSLIKKIIILPYEYTFFDEML